jgi:hypothetical protein
MRPSTPPDGSGEGIERRFPKPAVNPPSTHNPSCPRSSVGGAIARRQLDLAKADAQRTARELEQARGAWDLTVARDRLSALVPWRRGVRRG